MRNTLRRARLQWGLVAGMLLGLAGPLSAAVVFDNGSSWKYLVGNAEPSTPVSAWRQIIFDDSAWASGNAPVGYGEPDIASTIPAGTISVYLRKTFVVANPGDIGEISLNVRVDDGCVAWINGIEIGRFNVPAGELAYNAAATTAGEPAAATFTVNTENTNLLVAGTNVVTIHLLNANATSSDLLADASLVTQPNPSPTVVSTLPSAGGVATELGLMEVVFSESVAGVDASDLLIGGVAATNVQAYSPRGYIFSFPSPSTGQVVFAWAPNHGIADLSSTPHPFVGESWTVTFDPNAVVAAFLISELMADNKNGIQDEDGDRSDWIEIYNPGVVEANLEGWCLTDSSTNLTQWRFPNVVVGPNRYLIVWASGKDRTNSPSRLHTNFRLERSGENLMLVDPNTNIVSSFLPYPSQSSNVSYGRDRVDPNLVGFFTTPTPGAQNSTSGVGFAAEPTFSLASGVYTNNTISVTLAAPAGEIRYTTDGADPATNSTLYTGAISVTGNMVIKARVFAPGLWPSPIVARTYHLLDNTTRDFTSKLPILVINTSGRAIAANVLSGGKRTAGSFAVFDTFRGRSALQDKPAFQGLAQFEIFGQTSAGFPKLPYNVEINDEYGNDQRVSILGMPAEADWKLRNPYSDKPLMNDFLVNEIFEKMGHYALRRKLVEVFVDTGGGKLSYPGDYHGVFCLLERIEGGNDRVDIEELTPSHTAEPEISGGYIWKKDKDSAGDVSITTTGGSGFSGQTLKIHEPKPRFITTNQLAWLRNYLNRFESSMYAADWLTRTGTNHYSYYLDVDSMVDHHWIVEFTKQIDGYRLSNYMQKDRNGKIKMEPLWDWNLAFGNANYLEGEFTNGWYYPLINENEHIWLRRLICGTTAGNGTTGDPEFRQKIVDRWSELRITAFNVTNLLKRIDELAELLNEAAVRDNTKWPRWGTYIWPNPGFYSTPTTYQGIIDAMKRWVNGRYYWIDSQFTRMPALNHQGGTVAAGFNLVMTAPAGSIYYTLDGTDPRAPGGAIASNAVLYTSPVVISGNAHVFARARNGANWSGPNKATLVVQTPPLIITEIMFHPSAPPAGNTNNDDAFEYVELKNTGSTALNLAGFTLSGAIQFAFPALTLGASEYVLVVKNQAAFESRYGAGKLVAGEFTGVLDNAGERIVLRGPLQEPILDFTYRDAWHPVADGAGFALVVADEQAPLNTWGELSQWRRSASTQGSPGVADSVVSQIPQVVISEALTHTDLPVVDSIELLNLSSTEADISGWYLTDDFNNPGKYRIPANTRLAPGGLMVFTENEFNSGSNAALTFSLSSMGDEVYLFSANSNGELTGYVHGFAFGAQRNGVTFGRQVNSEGQEFFVAQSMATLSNVNSGSLVGPVVMSEIMYRPQEVFANGAYWNNTEDEYIELFNTSAQPVALYDTLHPTNSWRISGGAEFSFPSNTVIGAGEYLVVANFDPTLDPAQLAAFRAKYNVPSQVQVLGPFKGNLSNGDDTLGLYMPDHPEEIGPNAGIIPWILVEAVHYAGVPPWPVAADGMGHALQRLQPSAFGYDPANWTAGAPTPGTGFVAGTPPTIVAQPQTQTALSSQTVVFNVTAGGAGPFRYQWRYGAQNIGGATNDSLTLENVQVTDAGNYSVVVLNAASAMSSSNAVLTVLQAAVVTQQPEPLNVKPGTNATFRVAASSSSTLYFQWQFNGVDIPGATNLTLTLTNVQSSQDGEYQVRLTDDVGSVFSQPVRLTVLVDPAITQHPSNAILAVGETLELNTAVTNTATLPVAFRWRRNGSGVLTNEVLLRENTYTIPAIRMDQAGAYSVVAGNTSRPGGIVSGNAFIAVAIPPANQTVTAGANATFSVSVANPGTATRPARLLYQWQFNGADLPNAIGTNLVINNVQARNVGTYGVLVTMITNGTTSRLFTATLGFPAQDTDNDGIPDEWEQAFGYSINSPNNASEDPDGDTMTNYQEYIAGTDPTNSASCLKVEQVEMSGTASLHFVAMSNKTYTVQFNDVVIGGTWSNLANVGAQLTNRTATVSDPNPKSSRYYRLVTPQQP